MGVIQSFERRLQGAVGNTFARMFGGSVHPSEVVGALQAEAAQHLDRQGPVIVAHNRYTVSLGPSDHGDIGPDERKVEAALADAVREYLEQEGWQTFGDVAVTVTESDVLHTGQFRISSIIDPDVDRRRHLSAGVGPMSQPPADSGAAPPPAGEDADQPHSPFDPARYIPQPDPLGANPLYGSQPGSEPAYPAPGHHAGAHPFGQSAPNPTYGAPAPASPPSGQNPVYQGYPPPPYGQPQYGPPAQPGYPPYGQPAYPPAGADPAYGQPPYGQPQYGPPGPGQPPPAQPPQGQPPQGQPPQGQPPQGQPQYGQPSAPQPPYGQPQPAQAQYGQAPPAQPPYNQPPYNQPQYGQPQYGPPYGQPAYPPPGYGAPGQAPAPYGQPASPTYDPAYGYPPLQATQQQSHPEPARQGPPGQPPQTRDATAVLAVDDGSHRTYQLQRGSNIVGRGQDAAFRLPDTSVSRRHVDIYFDGQIAVMHDLGSTNGTSVNGSTVQTWQLADGDVIRVGHSTVVFSSRG